MSGPHDRLGEAVLRAVAKLPPSDAMGEMAREVLSGRMTMQEAMRSGAYSEAFAAASQDAVRTLDAMTPEERRAAGELGERAADLLDPPPPPPPKPAPNRPPAADDWDEPFTYPWDTRDF